jgi:hypothetical protein
MLGIDDDQQRVRRRGPPLVALGLPCTTMLALAAYRRAF